MSAESLESFLVGSWVVCFLLALALEWFIGRPLEARREENNEWLKSVKK
jgi:preprotein translocase subunit YajC